MLDLSRLSCLGEALEDATIAFKTNVALIEADRARENARYTYRELGQEAKRIGGALQARGLSPGDRCAILMSNQSKWIFGALGALWSGAVLVPLDYKLTAPEQLALLAHAGPKVLLTEYSVYRALRKEDLAPLERTLVIVSEAPARADLGPAVRYEQLQARAFRMHHRERDDVACIVYSSGTGGTPKGCMLTHGNYLAQAQSLGRLYPMQEQDRSFSILPTNHAIDFMCGFVLPLLFGAGVVHQRTLRPEFLMPTMREYGVSHMALVPRILKALRERIEEQLDEQGDAARSLVDTLARVNERATARGPSHRISRTLLRPIHDKFGGKLRLMICGGAFVERESAELFYRLGLPVAIGYGLTEAGTAITVNDLKPFRGDTVGVPVEGTRVELRDVNDAGVGEVWVTGPTVMKGYLDAPELTAEVLVDGWLRTGDLGRFDAAGHLKLLGRAKNMIVTEGGKNIYPEDIEAAFEGLAGCEELCVFAANYVWPTGKLTGEALMLVVRMKSGVEVDETWLSGVRALNQRLSDFKRVRGLLVWIDEFPRTASQKVKRQVLAREIADKAARDEAWIAL